MEVKAAETVDAVFKNPFDLKEKEKRQKINISFLRKIKPIRDEAIKEGVKFGSYIRQLTHQKIREKSSPSTTAAPTTSKEPFIIPTVKTEQDIFLTEIDIIETVFFLYLRLDTLKMKKRGMSNEEIKLNLRDGKILIDWAAAKNKIRQAAANYIAASANIGYYRGLINGRK